MNHIDEVEDIFAWFVAFMATFAAIVLWILFGRSN